MKKIKEKENDLLEKSWEFRMRIQTIVLWYLILLIIIVILKEIIF